MAKRTKKPMTEERMAKEILWAREHVAEEEMAWEDPVRRGYGRLRRLLAAVDEALGVEMLNGMGKDDEIERLGEEIDSAKALVQKQLAEELRLCQCLRDRDAMIGQQKYMLKQAEKACDMADLQRDALMALVVACREKHPEDYIRTRDAFPYTEELMG